MPAAPLLPEHRYRAPAALPHDERTITWHVARDPSAHLGASTALLLQVAHPKVAAGVAQHSDYAADPWRRLFRTLDTVLKLLFGDPDTVHRMERRLEVRHASVVGTTRDGEPYDARDPQLAMWVWATLVHTNLDVYERVHGRLDDRDRERLYRESLLFAASSGVPPERCPRSYGEFVAYVRRTVEEELTRTPESDAIARSVFEVPRPRLVGPLLGRANRATATAFLPPRARALFGLPSSARRERVTAHLLRGLGLGMRLVPRRLRHAPTDLVVHHDVLDRLERRRARRRRRQAGAVR